MTNRIIVSLKNISKSFQEKTAVNNLSLDIAEGTFVTLLGPSGCGKTTVLRLIAGLENCDSGEIFIDDILQNNIPPSRRNVNTVFQSYALFPHMTVFENIAFGLTVKKIDKREIKSRVKEALEMVKLSDSGNKAITQLSGGQQQRVAIARAIVNRPQIVLFDEALSALDYKLRKQMRIELKQLHRKLGMTFVFVTHDQEEALILSDQVVVMNNGKIEQYGTPIAIYEEPVNLFVADFVGECNIFEGEVLSTGESNMVLSVNGMAITCENKKGFVSKQKIKMLLRPEDMKVNRGYKSCKKKKMFNGRVSELIYKGTTVDIIVEPDRGKKIIASRFFDEDSEDIHYDMGEEVCISWYDGWEVILPDE